MIRVFTHEKPARPWLGVAFAAGSLAATLAAAWGLMQARNRPIELAPRSIHLPGWPFSFHLPKDWSLDEEHEEGAHPLWSDWVIASGSDSKGGRYQMEVGFQTLDANLPAHYAVLTLLKSAAAAPRTQPVRIAPTIVAGLRGHMIALAQTSRRGTTYVIGAAAALPNGRTLGVRLSGRDVPGATAYNLVRGVCEAMTLDGPRCSRDSRAAVENTGLICAPPGDGWIVTDATDPSPALRLTASDAADTSWHIEILPTFLLQDRTIDALLHDFLVSALLEAPPSGSITSLRIGDRPIVRHTQLHAELIREVWVVDLGEHRAAFVIGTTGAGRSEQIVAHMRAAIGALQVDPARWPFDLSGAQRRGEEWIRRTESEGVADLFSDRTSPRRWVIERAGVPDGDAQSAVRRSEEQPGMIRGEDAQRRFDDQRRTVYDYRRKWAIEERGGEFQSVETIQDRRDGVLRRVQTDLRRTGGVSRLAYEVTVDRRSTQVAFDPPANYLPDPLVGAAVGQVARSGRGHDVLFRVVTLSSQSLAGLYVAPGADEGMMGLQDWANVASSARVVLDCAPWTSFEFFDSAGERLGERRGFATVTRLPSQRDSMRRILDAFRAGSAGDD